MRLLKLLLTTLPRSQPHLDHEVVSAVHAYCDASTLPIAPALAKLTRIQCELLGRRTVPRPLSFMALKSELRNDLKANEMTGDMADLGR